MDLVTGLVLVGNSGPQRSFVLRMNRFWCGRRNLHAVLP